MQAKLTLKLDEDVIATAKKYAARRHKSLSKLIEDYFRSLSQSTISKDKSHGPIVQELIGIIEHAPIDETKSDYVEYLEKKYE